MTLSPNDVDILRRVKSGDLAEGGDDHTTFIALRSLRGRGLVAHVGDSRPKWILTPAGTTELARRDDYARRRDERLFGRATFAWG